MKRRRRSSRRSPWKSADTTSCFIRRISGSRFTSRSRIRPSSIAPWGEANYAGTSFVAPPDQFLGKFKYGPAFMNIRGDRSQPGALSTIGYDDDGVQPDDFLIVKDGVVNDYQTTREHELARLVVQAAEASHAVARLLVCRLVGERAVPAHA